MQKGELGTAAERRMIFIWEGVLANLPDRSAVRGMERVKCRLRLWDQAVGYWSIDENTLKWIWSIFSRTKYRIDLCVTTRPAGFARAVADLSEWNNWPIRYVFAQSAASLGRALPVMPDVERVFYGLAEHRWAFGPQGTPFPGLGQVV